MVRTSLWLLHIAGVLFTVGLACASKSVSQGEVQGSEVDHFTISECGSMVWQAWDYLALILVMYSVSLVIAAFKMNRP